MSALGWSEVTTLGNNINEGKTLKAFASDLTLTGFDKAYW
jgi:hypothetical protein